MPDGYFESFPIPRKNVDLAGMQQNIANLQSGLAQEILDRTAADATKANKTTTINGKSLAEDRVIYAQDIPSKNLLPNTASTTTINGVTFTVNSDGSVSCSGTSTGDAILFVSGTSWDSKASFPFVGGQQYILSGCPSGGASNSYRMAIWEYNGSTNLDHFDDTGNGVTFTANASANGMIVIITIPNGVNATGMTFRPMIRLASIEDDSYVPYAKTNVELSRGLIDISSSFVWNPNVTFSTKTLVAFYDPVRHLVMGNMAYDASAAISSSTYHIQIASAYRPKSNSAQPCMYYHSSDSAWKVASLTFGANGNITQGTTNYWKSTLCSFMYSV